MLAHSSDLQTASGVIRVEAGYLRGLKLFRDAKLRAILILYDNPSEASGKVIGGAILGEDEERMETSDWFGPEGVAADTGVYAKLIAEEGSNARYLIYHCNCMGLHDGIP